MFSNSFSMIISMIVFLGVVFCSQANAAHYRVNCSQTSASEIEVGGQIEVTFSNAPPFSQKTQIEIVKQAVPGCQEMIQAQVDALSCSTLPAGSLFAFQVGYFANSSFKTFAFYNEGYLSSTDYSSYGFVRKNSCP